MTTSPNDLSISELSLHSDQTLKPFSLLASTEPELHTEEPVAQEPPRHSAKAREEKLQSDIFILKKLNASLELFNEALQDTGSTNQYLAAQLEQTDALLDKYVTILSRSEDYSRLIFDENWMGAEADECALEERQIEERARRKAQEQAIQAQQEQERLEREKQDRLKAEHSERAERDKTERTTRGGVRGVRGTRASMRAGRGTGPPRAVDTHTNTTRGVPKRQSSTSTRASGSGIARGISRQP